MFAIIALLFTPLDELAEAQRLAPKYSAEVEVQLWDRSRCDLLSDEYAIEIDWASKPLKWAEAVGQSLYYAELTGRKPAIILLVEDRERDMKNVYKCQTVCARVGIRLFVEEIE